MVSVDPRRRKFYYVLDNSRIIEDSLDGTDSPRVLVDDIGNVGGLVLDDR